MACHAYGINEHDVRPSVILPVTFVDFNPKKVEIVARQDRPVFCLSTCIPKADPDRTILWSPLSCYPHFRVLGRLVGYGKVISVIISASIGSHVALSQHFSCSCEFLAHGNVSRELFVGHNTIRCEKFSCAQKPTGPENKNLINLKELKNFTAK